MSPRPRGTLYLCLLLLCLVPACGCEMETRIVNEPFASLPADPPGQEGVVPEDRGADRHGQMRGDHWAVPLEQFQGPDRQQQAERFIAQIRDQADRRDTWVEDRAGVTHVYLGRFDDPAAPEARQALQQAQSIEIQGQRPFADARLTPAGGSDAETDQSPYNLQQYPGYYSLQIAFYDQEHDRDRREAAEQHVQQLRDENHEAYFYHGSNVSMVTVGLFMQEEAFVPAEDTLTQDTGAQRDAYSPRVRQLQEDFPHNLGNGEPVMEPDPAGGQRPQRSELVRVF